MSYPAQGQWRPPAPRRKLKPLAIVLIVAGALFGGCSVLTVIGLAASSVAPPGPSRDTLAVPIQPAATTAPPPQTTTPALATSPPSEPTVTVPEVRSLDGSEARKRLRDAGLSAVELQAVNGRSVLMESMWHVVDQTPKPGEQVAASQPVILTVDRFKRTPPPEQQEQSEPAERPKPTKKPRAQLEPQTDPRFDTCAEANANGYGPYDEGSDAEYDWYQDRDGDGRVCEPG